MFNWYRLFNNEEFISTELTSMEIIFDMIGIGEKTVLITRGENTSILYEEVFLSVNLNDKNPFRMGEHAVFIDPNDDVWLGIYSES